MDKLRNIGTLFVRHYEKVLVAVALLGLVYAVYHLNSQKQAEEETIQKYNQTIKKKQTQSVPVMDMAMLTNALQSAKQPPALNFGLPHNLFNPVKWQRRPDGSVIKIEKGTEVGPAALKLANVSPLNTTISIVKAAGTGLQMSTIQEASTNRAFRSRLESYVNSNATDRTKLFTLREIHGTPDKPEALIELTGSTGEKVTLASDKPFTRVDGYKVDLNYPPENKNFKNLRVSDVFHLAGEDYIIVAINPNEVVVSARSNNRRTTIRNNAGP